MSEEKINLEDSEAVRSWAENVAQDLARRLVKRGILSGKTQVEARWAAPGHIFLGIAWQEDRPRDRYWVIGGEAVTPDVVPLSVADNPRDAARHFYLRWQMAGAKMGANANGEGKHPGLVDWTGLEERFARQAEMLYDLTTRDSVWEGTGKES